MSSDIYAKPDLSKKVRYNRKVKEDNVEWEEREVVIYESADAIRDDQTDFQSREGGPHTEKHRPSVQRRPFRAATLCLGVLCFLMLTGIIILSIHHTSVTFELQTRLNKLSNNNSQLHGTMSGIKVNNRKLQDEVKQLKAKIEGKWCPEGWMRFGCSCYFKSNERKTWSYSRSDCQNKGADLVIINNEEEQKFVTELNSIGNSWIGLQGTNGKWTGSGTVWEWKWVDSSPLTQTFWASGMPYSSWNQYAAAFCDTQGKWKVSSSSEYKNWICEK
ncbi:CD209 antigen-like protein A isoform X2 [Dicentrarchus labrax]|uniref:CD209 antigen-like protein A isoform X2 n=1 Tax=Dicentrarchus labrax TaxID=13489 RepID=UPI0021F5707A|nr:CD209 antigen-like protein A isoform X2 [Dicentrarchus labrax]